MLKLLNDGYTRRFSNPQVAMLALLLLIGLSFIVFSGKILAPLLAAIIITYLLDGAVHLLRRWLSQ